MDPDRQAAGSPTASDRQRHVGKLRQRAVRQADLPLELRRGLHLACLFRKNIGRLEGQKHPLKSEALRPEVVEALKVPRMRM